ncbi:MAG: PepSY-associated TM helix domain-containing protein [Propionibacteriaceae bacterium]|nr:PepSY-associated TM helix domain-containing protein [Micropruina sp.]
MSGISPSGPGVGIEPAEDATAGGTGAATPTRGPIGTSTSTKGARRVAVGRTTKAPNTATGRRALQGNPPRSGPRRGWPQRWARKLHVWISMVSLTLIIFFGATGFVLNHSDWTWGGDPVTTQVTGTLASNYLNPVDVEKIATFLRNERDIVGEVVSNSTSGTSLTISTSGPGATSSVIVDTSTGDFTATKTMNGFMAFLTDLHRGNPVTKQWGWLVDASAIALVVIGLTGLLIGILTRSRHRMRDVLLALGGLVATIVLLFLAAPRG